MKKSFRLKFNSFVFYDIPKEQSSKSTLFSNICNQLYCMSVLIHYYTIKLRKKVQMHIRDGRSQKTQPLHTVKKYTGGEILHIDQFKRRHHKLLTKTRI